MIPAGFLSRVSLPINFEAIASQGDIFMTVNTRHFGPVEYSTQDIIHFTEGLYGFENETDYLPISLEEDNDSLLLFQCITNEEIAFIVMNPFYLMENYQPLILDSDRKLLGSPQDENISFYVICVLKERIEDSTVNLKCPIAVNAVTRVAKQVILNQPEYAFKHQIKRISTKEG